MLRKNRRRNFGSKFLLVITTVVLTTVAKYWMEEYLGEGPPLLLFLPSIILCAFIGGFATGASATFLAGVLAIYFFLAPKFQFAIASPNDRFRLVVFTLIALLISYLFERLHAHEFEIESSNAKLKEMTQELARSNEELERFAFTASHDLQEPLRMVASYLALMEKRNAGAFDRESLEYLSFAKDGAKRMSDLIVNLLRYSKAGSAPIPIEVTDCQRAANNAVTNLKMAIEDSGAVVTIDALPVIQANPVLMEELFQNLISNGIKYHAEKPPQLTVSTKQVGRDWEFLVSDNGIGIAPENTVRIFEAFKRLHGREIPGTGIGLATCKKIVDRLGGHIWVESEVGKGTIFHFSLPGGMSSHFDPSMRTSAEAMRSAHS